MKRLTHRARIGAAMLPCGTAITASATTAQPVTTVIKPRRHGATARLRAVKRDLQSRGGHLMARITGMLIAASLPLVALGGLAAPPSPASADAGEATHYYLSLGDSLAESFQPTGGLTHGYTEAVFKAIHRGLRSVAAHQVGLRR